MTNKYNNEKFWLEDPQTLFLNFHKFNPVSSFSTETLAQTCNIYTRLIILSMIVIYCITKKINYIYIGIFLILVIIIMYYSAKKDAFENYASNVSNVSNDFRANASYLLNQEQLPERRSDNFDTNVPINNPLKNVPITDYDKKQEYSQATMSDADMSKFIKNKIFQTADQYIFDRDSRQYYTMPNSSVPNDQDAFAQWLYGTENICKEGSIYMHRSGTPQQTLSCNGFNVSTPTNFGNLNNYKS